MEMRECNPHSHWEDSVVLEHFVLCEFHKGLNFVLYYSRGKKGIKDQGSSETIVQTGKKHESGGFFLIKLCVQMKIIHDLFYFLYIEME